MTVAETSPTVSSGMRQCVVKTAAAALRIIAEPGGIAMESLR